MKITNLLVKSILPKRHFPVSLKDVWYLADSLIGTDWVLPRITGLT